MQRKQSGSASLLAGEEGAEGSPKLGRRRQELVDVAANIFAEKGYHATSVQDIASELGILKGSICSYLDAKEDLVATAILSMVAWTHRRLGKSRRSRVEGLGEAFADLVLAGVICTSAAHSAGHRGQVGVLPAVW